MAELTGDMVQAIRNLYGEQKYTQGELAVRFGVSDTTISRIVNNKRWSQPT